MSIIISPEVCPHCHHHNHGHYEWHTCWTCGGTGTIHCNHNHWQPTWTLTSCHENGCCTTSCCCSTTTCSRCNGLGYTLEWVYDPSPCCIVVNCEKEKPVKEKPENNFRQGLGINKKKIKL
jgi:hypothetical protein